MERWSGGASGGVKIARRRGTRRPATGHRSCDAGRAAQGTRDPAGLRQGAAAPRFEEATGLIDVGPNLVGRPQKLTPRAADRWQAMREAAAEEGIRLLLVSGFRSVEYQAALIRRKLEAGQSIEDILAVNAAPASASTTPARRSTSPRPGSRPLTEEFEGSPAFRWLGRPGGRFRLRA